MTLKFITAKAGGRAPGGRTVFSVECGGNRWSLRLDAPVEAISTAIDRSGTTAAQRVFTSFNRNGLAKSSGFGDLRP